MQSKVLQFASQARMTGVVLRTAEFGHNLQGFEILVQRAAEQHLADPLVDFGSRFRNLRAVRRNDLDDEEVGGLGGSHEREQRRIGRVAAIPISFTANRY